MFLAGKILFSVSDSFVTQLSDLWRSLGDFDNTCMVCVRRMNILPCFTGTTVTIGCVVEAGSPVFACLTC